MATRLEQLLSSEGIGGSMTMAARGVQQDELRAYLVERFPGFAGATYTAGARHLIRAAAIADVMAISPDAYIPPNIDIPQLSTIGDRYRYIAVATGLNERTGTMESAWVVVESDVSLSAGELQRRLENRLYEIAEFGGQRGSEMRDVDLAQVSWEYMSIQRRD